MREPILDAQPLKSTSSGIVYGARYPDRKSWRTPTPFLGEVHATWPAPPKNFKKFLRAKMRKNYYSQIGRLGGERSI